MIVYIVSSGEVHQGGSVDGVYASHERAEVAVFEFQRKGHHGAAPGPWRQDCGQAIWWAPPVGDKGYSVDWMKITAHKVQA